MSGCICDTVDQVEAAINGHILAQAQLTGLFQRT